MSSLEIDWYWNVGFVARQSSSISKKATCSKLCRANYWSKIWLLSHLFRSEFPRNMADCLFWVTYFYALSYCSLINFFPFSPFANLVDSPNNLNGKMLSAQPQMQVSNFELTFYGNSFICWLHINVITLDYCYRMIKLTVQVLKQSATDYIKGFDSSSYVSLICNYQ